jgi:hypothetical protein
MQLEDYFDFDNPNGIRIKQRLMGGKVLTAKRRQHVAAGVSPQRATS